MRCRGDRPLFLALALIALGCGDDEPIDPPKPPIEVQPGLFIEEGTPLRLLYDGDPLDVVFAAQGGQVMYVGARVNHLEPGEVNIASQLSNPETGVVLIEDARTIEIEAVPDSPEWLEPKVKKRSGISHLLACPNYTERSVIGVPWVLEIQIGDLAGTRTGTGQVEVVPTCVYEGPLLEICQCECDANYYYSKCPAPG